MILGVVLFGLEVLSSGAQQHSAKDRPRLYNYVEITASGNWIPDRLAGFHSLND